MEQVDAHSLGCNLIITDGFEGTAVGGVDQQQNDADTYA